ncbi:MAG TPA: hypothetical protein PKH24_21190 [Sedimentisphaerales bacterium]|jgi:hypothetical protein|nr:hypothetical protein [Sedimentisphaerales bacterium]HNU28932.1 hypothetical protein [Sedimentisphaerales bacterium]
MSVWRVVFGLSVLVRFCGASTGDARNRAFPETTLERALEMGCSLVVAEIRSVRCDDRMYHYNAKIVRTVVPGDLTKEEANRTWDLFAGASYGDALKTGSCYAMFISRDSPNSFAWAFRDDVLEIDPLDRDAVVRLQKAADRVYAGTAIQRFRRGRVWWSNEAADLPEELASLCKEFRDHPGRRTEAGRRIAESDLGSRTDESRPESSIRAFLPPTIVCSRKQMISLLGYPSWTSGWTYSWRCDDQVNPAQGGGQIGILSVMFDPNEQAVRVLYGMEERSKWIRPARREDYLAQAEGDPAGVALAFQEALGQSDWERALSYCSQRVKAEAARSDSTEAFFKRFVPVEQIVALPGFRPGGFESRDGKVTRMCVRVEIEVPGDRPFISWPWSLVRVGETWLVDFEPVPLDVSIRKELLRQKFVEQRPRWNAEEFAKAIDVHLAPVSEEFVIGKPMLFRVEMRNVSDAPIPYSRSGGVMTGDPMSVTGPDGQTVPYVDTSYQIGIGLDVLLPGETVVLADRYDVTSQYRIIQPGRYRFQLRGWPRDSELSNVCEVEVKAGALSDAERISEDLLSVMPAGWRFERMLAVSPGEEDAPGAGGLFFNLIGRRQGKGGDQGVFLQIHKATDPADIDPWLKEALDPWGLSPWGLVYARVNEAERLWPNYRAQIDRALGIKPLPR